MSIQNELDKIKGAIKGTEVRGAIHDGIKKAYDDASVDKDNANMEVKLARGKNSTLNERLNKTEDKIEDNKKDIQIADTSISSLDTMVMSNKSDLDSKPDKAYLDGRIDAIVATPTTASEQEIIDARDGEVSLGAKVRTLSADMDKKIGLDKFEGINKSNNWFNTAGSVLGFVDRSNGKITPTDTNRSTDFILIPEVFNINFKTVAINMAFYTERKESSFCGSRQILEPTNSVVVVESPEGARYARISTLAEHFYDTYVYEGPVEKEADDFHYYPTGLVLDEEALKPYPNSVSPTETTFIEVSKNMFNKDTIEKYKWVKGDDGKIYDGAVSWASDFIKVDPLTTYSIVSNPSNDRYAMYDINKVHIKGPNNFVLDQKVTTPTEGHYIRFSLHISTDPNSVQFEKGEVSTDYVPFGSFMKDYEASNLMRKDNAYNKNEIDNLINSEYRNSQLYFSKKYNRLEISTPVGTEDKYHMIYFTKQTQPYVDGGTYQNADTWRLMQSQFGTIVEGKFVHGDVITTSGAWECAISVHGLPDFHGTLHGYELMKDITFLVDGKDTSFSEDVVLNFKCLEIIINVDLIRQGTKNTVIAEASRHYTFDGNGINIKQRYLWKESHRIKEAYLGMCPVVRKATPSDLGSKQITDRAWTDNDYIAHDVSLEGHTTPVSEFSEVTAKAGRFKIWGTTSGYSVDMSFKDDKGTENNAFYCASAAAYNKLYLSYRRDQTTQIGDVWKVEAQYKIQSN